MAKAPAVPPALQGLITPEQFQKLAGKGGRLSGEELARSGLPLPPPPKGYQYTYQFSQPNAPLQLKKDPGGILKKIGQIASIAAPIAAAPFTGGATLALIGAGSGAAGGLLGGGGLKGALLGAGLGGASAGLGSALSGAGKAAGAIPGNVGFGGGIGGTGSFLAGGATKMPMNWGSIASSLLKNPDTYGTIASAVKGGGGAAPAAGAGAAGGGGAGGLLSNLPPWLAEAIGGVGTTAGGAAKDVALGRAKENELRAFQDRTAGDVYGTQQGAHLNMLQLLEKALQDRAKMGVEAPTARLNQLIRGSLLSNIQPAQISGFSSRVKVPQLSGGLTPAALSGAARAGGGEMQRQALMALLSGSDVPKMPNFAGGLIAPPKPQGIQGAGALESILSGAGLGGSLLGTILGPLQKAQQAKQAQINAGRGLSGLGDLRAQGIGAGVGGTQLPTDLPPGLDPRLAGLLGTPGRAPVLPPTPISY